MSTLADQRSAPYALPPFTPFSPGGMNRSSGGKVHRCTICGRPFTRPSTLATHLNTHTGEKPHLCPVKSCGSRFSVSSNLRRHIKRHKLPGAGPMPRAQRKKTTGARKEPANRRPRVLQERKNESWCPESLRGMRNAKGLSSRAPFEMAEGAAPLRAPLPVVRPHGQIGDENYEDRDSFFYAHEMDQIMPYHPLAWGLRPTLPGPLPSHADREARARSAHGYGGSLSGLGV
ncbi:unnamed protein product [Rhizoctonia solani]|nr:unnamed protein product [Rhizoctonia solani]